MATSLLVGATLATASDSISNRLVALTEIGGNALQIYLSSPNSNYPGRPLTTFAVDTVLEYRQYRDLYVVVHGKHTVNFCRPLSSATEWQKTAVVSDLIQADRINADLILHQGKNLLELRHPSQHSALQTYVANLQEVIKATPTCTNRILLENSCQQGGELGYTVAQLAEIWGLLDPVSQGRVGFCLDLAHVFVAGACDVRDPAAVDEFFQEFDRLIGITHLHVIHFNDSHIAFGGCNDHHADILTGWIGNPRLGGSIKGFRKVVQWAARLGIPMILETPSEFTSTALQIQQIKDLLKEDVAPFSKWMTEEDAMLVRAEIYHRTTEATTKARIKQKGQCCH